MKINCINILLISVSLNILVNTHKKTSITPRHTPKIQTTRLLCECELYSPANYDSDPEMKRVMQQFEDRTTQRFHEYDERLQSKRMQCKEQCDKEIQKIILKDKLEKQMVEQFSTLQTDIQNDAIPTCICEKSIEDKVEKACLRCTQNLGGIVAPSSGVLLGIAEGALYAWKPKALEAAIAAAKEAGVATGLLEGIEAGKKAVMGALKEYFFTETLGINSLDSYFTKGYYFDIENLATVILERRDAICGISPTLDDATCNKIGISIGTMLRNGERAAPGTGPIVQRLKLLPGKAKTTADYVTNTTTEKVTAELTTKQTTAINATYASYEITIIASIVAIVIIVLIMVIIYLILRYRRKKKMKKKLQYIKLLEE
ncbi:rifin [Plasmodium falciparum IGH-CR14]|uniref:Rifin n=1 Tax=Plasmodium falciparum IGH-CR14 TaxID=580059 RepID=A0A0L1I4G9_PLAFA|nr:rifin [Plasmodium falciparum IGH-CR14]